MAKLMPQEVELWYVIPALRRQLAKVFVGKHNMTQRKAAQLLGITEAAASQYLSAKRGKDVKFTKTDMAEIEKTAQAIIDSEGDALKHVYKLCKTLRGSKTICDLHRHKDKGVPEDCDICMEK
jgi:hypothetical protein